MRIMDSLPPASAVSPDTTAAPAVVTARALRRPQRSSIGPTTSETTNVPRVIQVDTFVAVLELQP